MNVRLSAVTLAMAVICLLALTVPSPAVNVGRWTVSSTDAVSLSRPAVSTFYIQYQPEGYYLGVPPVPLYVGGTNFCAGGAVTGFYTGLYGTPMTGRGGYMRYYGRNTLLEPVDSNYFSTAFITQFLEDP